MSVDWSAGIWIADHAVVRCPIKTRRQPMVLVFVVVWLGDIVVLDTYLNIKGTIVKPVRDCATKGVYMSPEFMLTLLSRACRELI